MHTVKNTVIAAPSQMILFVGTTVLGAIHDYRLLKEEFPPQFNWFKRLGVTRNPIKQRIIPIPNLPLLKRSITDKSAKSG